MRNLGNINILFAGLGFIVLSVGINLIGDWNFQRNNPLGIDKTLLSTQYYHIFGMDMVIGEVCLIGLGTILVTYWGIKCVVSKFKKQNRETT